MYPAGSFDIPLNRKYRAISQGWSQNHNILRKYFRNEGFIKKFKSQTISYLKYVEIIPLSLTRVFLVFFSFFQGQVIGRCHSKLLMKIPSEIRLG